LDGYDEAQKAKLMPWYVSHVECVPLREFGIFNRNPEGNMLFFLRDRIMRWHGNRQTQQCYGRESERGALIHDFSPSANCAAKIGNRCHPTCKPRSIVQLIFVPMGSIFHKSGDLGSPPLSLQHS
jgi:hypothetical protein